MRRKIVRPALAVLLLASLCAACGSRRTQSELLAAARGGSGSRASSLGAGDQGGSDLGTPGDTGASGLSGGASGGTGAGGPAAGAAGATLRGAAGSGAGGGGASGSQSANKSPVSIAALGTFSGITGASQAPYLDGLRVWIRFINDRGGLNGHPVNQLIVADDGNDTARNRQLAQQLVEQNKVLALVFDGSQDASGTVPYVQGAGVPFVGGIGTGQYFYESPVYFPQMPTGNALAETGQGMFPELVRQGKTKIATITCVESAKVCNAAAAVAKKTAPKYGAQVVYATQASITAPDYSAECLNARNAGAQVISIGMDAASGQRIQQSCARQGYHPVYETASVVVNADTAKNDDFQGMVIVNSTMPLAGDPAPLAEFRSAMAKYAPGVAPIDGMVEAWAVGKILELGSKNLPEGDVGTLRKALLNGLWATPPNTDLGITAPLQYSPNKPAAPVVCWFLQTVQNHKFAPLNGGQRTCAPYDPSLVS